MKLVSFEQLCNDFGRIAPNSMNVSIYRANYSCACGKVHYFTEYSSIIGMGFKKLLVQCPDDPRYLTILKFKTAMLFKFKGFDCPEGALATKEQIWTMKELLRKG